MNNPIHTSGVGYISDKIALNSIKHKYIPTFQKHQLDASEEMMSPQNVEFLTL